MMYLYIDNGMEVNTALLLTNKIKAMKKQIISSVVILLLGVSMTWAQSNQQNPNADKAYSHYQKRLEKHEQNMGATVNNTYVARDPMKEKKDERVRRRQERRDFRRQLKLERARRPMYGSPRYYHDSPWNNTYPY